MPKLKSTDLILYEFLSFSYARNSVSIRLSVEYSYVYIDHRLLKIRTDGSQSRVRKLGSIGIFCIFTLIL